MIPCYYVQILYFCTSVKNILKLFKSVIPRDGYQHKGIAVLTQLAGIAVFPKLTEMGLGAQRQVDVTQD